MDPSDVGKKLAELAAQKTGSHMAPTQDEWTAHIKESRARAEALDARDARIEAALHDLALSTGSAISDLTAQITGLRITVESFANKNAQIRASAQLAHAPPLDAGATHTALRALGDADADAAVSSLSIWKAKPTLVVGFVGTVIALAVAFGLPITKEQVGAILAAVFAGLTLVASMRGTRTTAALVRAGERRGALAGPESQR